MEAELVYYGKFTDLAYLNNLPWSHFKFFYEWLADVKKKETEAQEKARKAQEAAAARARSKTRSPSKGSFIPRAANRRH